MICCIDNDVTTTATSEHSVSPPDGLTAEFYPPMWGPYKSTDEPHITLYIPSTLRKPASILRGSSVALGASSTTIIDRSRIDARGLQSENQQSMIREKILID